MYRAYEATTDFCVSKSSISLSVILLLQGLVPFI